ncbi:HIRAN domain-containing protein [Uliginosibacterium sp. H1]|uniref:HIRAN domain-containing protein n=1 Tax=Uliginosibacterium sp. H1 TaxID=3114757 RepID=UPI002E184435|nr:HIRAN domain-containing protein [Uliginosibacterium sp. H1]
MAARRVFGVTPLRLSLAALSAAVLAANIHAEGRHALIQRAPLAGFTYHAGPALWPQLREGDTLELALERDNRHDAQAVLVLWQGQKLGYLPAVENGAVARALAAGTPLAARIGRLRQHANPRERVLVEVLRPLPAP